MAARPTRPRAGLAGVLAAAVLVVACALFGPLLWHDMSGRRELAEARSTWERRPFTHYRLLVQEQVGGASVCLYEIEVSDEQVVSILRNTCRQSTPTVSEIFDLLSRNATIRADAGARARVTASYHPTLGYPEAIHTSVVPLPAWLTYDYWRGLVARESAQSDTATLAPDSFAISLQPLP